MITRKRWNAGDNYVFSTIGASLVLLYNRHVTRRKDFVSLLSSAKMDQGGIGMEAATEAKVFSGGEWLQLRDDLALPPRQAAVVEQLFLGHSDKQIAYELNMSVATVRTHLRRLFSRFEVEDRCGLVVEVFTHFQRQCQPC